MTNKPGMDNLSWGMRTGGAMFQRCMGKGLWEWLEQDPQRDRIMNLGMAETDKAGGWSPSLAHLPACDDVLASAGAMRHCWQQRATVSHPR